MISFSVCQLTITLKLFPTPIFLMDDVHKTISHQHLPGAGVNSFSVKGNIVDIPMKKIYPGKVFIEDGKIRSIEKLSMDQKLSNFILPGFIDAHVHIESSMLVPSEFARLAVVHGTVATISDPHEIANVCGLQGVEFMIENGKTVPFKFHFAQ